MDGSLVPQHKGRLQSATNKLCVKQAAGLAGEFVEMHNRRELDIQQDNRVSPGQGEVRPLAVLFFFSFGMCGVTLDIQL